MTRDLILIPRGGRPPKQAPTKEELAEMRKTLSVRKIAERYKVSEATVYRWLRKTNLVRKGGYFYAD